MSKPQTHTTNDQSPRSNNIHESGDNRGKNRSKPAPINPMVMIMDSQMFVPDSPKRYFALICINGNAIPCPQHMCSPFKIGDKTVIPIQTQEPSKENIDFMIALMIDRSPERTEEIARLYACSMDMKQRNEHVDLNFIEKLLESKLSKQKFDQVTKRAKERLKNEHFY